MGPRIGNEGWACHSTVSGYWGPLHSLFYMEGKLNTRKCPKVIIWGKSPGKMLCIVKERNWKHYGRLLAGKRMSKRSNRFLIICCIILIHATVEVGQSGT